MQPNTPKGEILKFSYHKTEKSKTQMDKISSSL